MKSRLSRGNHNGGSSSSFHHNAGSGILGGFSEPRKDSAPEVPSQKELRSFPILESRLAATAAQSDLRTRAAMRALESSIALESLASARPDRPTADLSRSYP